MLAAVDDLITAGLVANRSEAVRMGLEQLLDQHRRTSTASQIVASYRERPQSDQEVGWADAATVEMIADEPW
jgi:Arc/MetJ-type ribon-helix-helix transcriptional regulator